MTAISSPIHSPIKSAGVNKFGGLTIPRAGLIMYMRDGVDSIGLSANALWDALPTTHRSIYLSDRDTLLDAATIIANIEASAYLNDGGELVGSEAKGYAQYGFFVSSRTLKRAYKLFDETYSYTRTATQVNHGATAGTASPLTLFSQFKNHTTLTYQTFEEFTDQNGKIGVHAVHNGTSTAMCGTNPIFAVVAGRYYEITARVNLVVGAACGLTVVGSVGGTVLDDTAEDYEEQGFQDGIVRKRYYAATTRNIAIQFPTSSVGNGAREFYYSDIAVNEILPATVDTRLQTVAFWGDSTTQGIYPYRLRNLMINGLMYNGGVGGESSTQIKARFLAAPEKHYMPTVIWVGANNIAADPSTVISDTAAMVAALKTSNYLVMLCLGNNTSTTGTQYRTNINTVKAAYQAAYGSRFVDIEDVVRNSYDPDIPQDVTDYNNGITPSSLRTDIIHLTYDGYDIVANYLFDNYTSFFTFD